MNSGNDTDVSIFSSEGHVYQVEYAGKAVENSGTCIGICCQDGVVLCAEKIFSSKMVDMKESARRCHAVDYHAGVCIAGYLPDGRALVSQARDEAKNMRDMFSVPITGSVLARRVGDFMHVYTIQGGARPFGASAVLAAFGDDGPTLHIADPSGAVVGYYACALGKGKTVAKSQLEEIDFSKITCREAVKKAAAVLYDVHDAAKDKMWEPEFAWVCEESKRRFVPVPENLIPPKPGQQQAAAAAGGAAAAAAAAAN